MLSRFLCRPGQQTVVGDLNVTHPSTFMPPRLAFERFDSSVPKKWRVGIWCDSCYTVRCEGRGRVGRSTVSRTTRQLKAEARRRSNTMKNCVFL